MNTQIAVFRKEYKMLVLDTNALYYSCGLSTPPQDVDKRNLLHAIDSAETVVISYVTLAEFLTKYRKHAGIVRRVCSFMRNHHIHVIDCKLMPINSDFVKRLARIRQNDLNIAFSPIFEAKINIESRFAAGVFLVLLICETIFECNINPMDLSAPAFEFLSVLFKILRENLVPVFDYLYRDAYKTDDAENYIRRAIYRLLDTFIPVLMPLCQKVLYDIENCSDVNDSNVLEIIKSFSHSEWEVATQSYHKRIDKQKTPIHFVQKRGITYGKGINDKHLNVLLNGLEASIQKIIGYNALNEYFFTILKKSITQGGAFQKNDINDALILCALKTDDIIISFDKGMIAHLKEYESKHEEYKNSTTFISSLRQSQQIGSFKCVVNR